MLPVDQTAVFDGFHAHILIRQPVVDILVTRVKTVPLMFEPALPSATVPLAWSPAKEAVTIGVVAKAVGKVTVNPTALLFEPRVADCQPVWTVATSVIFEPLLLRRTGTFFI
jgi:hypothetical protein